MSAYAAATCRPTCLAHSLTLASAALGWLTLRSAPVEACIALSIVLVASEALRQRKTLARRLPALVALLFGLAWAVLRAVRRQPWGPRLRVPVLYTIGVLAAYWSWLRLTAVLG